MLPRSGNKELVLIPPLILVVGGARSGKSRYAERLLAQHGSVHYIATAGPPRDSEMAARIAAHVARRPAGWKTIDAPIDLAGAVRDLDAPALLDCLTLWLTNVMLAEHDLEAEVTALLTAMEARQQPVVAVSNEVGEGIVPETPLGRRFRDWQGILNQRVAERATGVVKLVAGCPLIVKPSIQPELSI